MGKNGSTKHFEHQPDKVVHVQHVVHLHFSPQEVIKLLRRILDPLEQAVKGLKIYTYGDMSDKQIRSQYQMLSIYYCPKQPYGWMIAQLRGILAYDAGQLTLCYGDVTELIVHARYVLDELERTEIKMVFDELEQQKATAALGLPRKKFGKSGQSNTLRFKQRHLRRSKGKPSMIGVSTGRGG